MGGIPDIRINGQSIENIGVNGTGIRFIGTQQIYNPNRIVLEEIPDRRIWEVNPPQSMPVAPPVTVRAGTPIVDMPGCVVVNKENAKNPTNRNNQLVNDDPKQNVALCDAGMPYYEPPNYKQNELSWQTVYGEPEEEEEERRNDDDGGGGESGAGAEEPPPSDEPEGDPECPGPLQPRLGSVGPNEKEKVSGFELQPDPNNLNKKICVVLYEDIGVVEQFLPSPQVATTTAVIASVAASSALLAKPLADLLLRVVKPAVKQVMTKVNGVLGKTPYRPTQKEIQTNLYRVKKGLVGINFAKEHSKKMKKQKEEEKKKSQKKN